MVLKSIVWVLDPVVQIHANYALNVDIRNNIENKFIVLYRFSSTCFFVLTTLPIASKLQTISSERIPNSWVQNMNNSNFGGSGKTYVRGGLYDACVDINHGTARRVLRSTGRYARAAINRWKLISSHISALYIIVVTHVLRTYYDSRPARTASSQTLRTPLSTVHNVLYGHTGPTKWT